MNSWLWRSGAHILPGVAGTLCNVRNFLRRTRCCVRTKGCPTGKLRYTAGGWKSPRYYFRI